MQGIKSSNIGEVFRSSLADIVEAEVFRLRHVGLGSGVVGDSVTLRTRPSGRRHV